MHVTFDLPVTPGQSESGPYSCFILAQAFHKAAQFSGLIALEPFGKLMRPSSRKRLTNSRACWATLAIAGESCSRAFTKAFCLPSRAAGSCNSHQVAWRGEGKTSLGTPDTAGGRAICRCRVAQRWTAPLDPR